MKLNPSSALVAPRIGADVISRARLNRHLAELSRRRLTIVRAPAGFGKSTMLRQWYEILAQRGEETAWLSVDRHAEDIVSMIISALSAGIAGFQDALSSRIVSGAFVTTDAELAAVVACLDGIEAQVFMLIDDAHLLTREDVRVLERFIERMPQNCHVVLATRKMPDLPIGRLRAYGELLEVDMNQLRFTVEEARQFLDDVGDLTEDDVRNLVERTEGWAAGLRLAGLTMSQGASGAKLIASFSGSKSVIADFFSEDVFGSQPQDVQSFLLQTCLLDRFSAELCDRVTGREDSREMILRVEASGLFLIRLDHDESWFRYHGLFAGFLSRRLGDLDASAAERIHVAASRWFYENGFIFEAVDHAERSGNKEFLGEVLEETCEELVYRGRLTQVAALGETLPRHLRNQYPRLLLQIAWMKIRGLKLGEARHAIDLAGERIEALEHQGHVEEEPGALKRMHMHREMMLAAALDDFQKADHLAAQLMKEVNDLNPYILCNLYGQSIRAEREQFKYVNFERFEARARTVLENSKHYKFAFVAQQAIIGMTLFYLGRNEEARRALDYGMSQAIDFAGEKSPLAALPALPTALIAYDSNDLNLAAELVEYYLPVVRVFGFSDEVLAGYLTASRVAAAQGDVAAAFRHLDEAKNVGLETGLPRIEIHAMAETVRLMLRTGHAERALELARRGGLPEDYRALAPTASATTSDEVLAMTWVRLAMNQGELQEALQLAQRWRQFGLRHGAVRHVMCWNLLVAQLLALGGDGRAAQRHLREALVAGAEGGCIRIFVDEGQRIQDLLSEGYENGPITKHPADLFAHTLLDAFLSRARGRLADAPAGLLEEEANIDGKMTGREIEILNCVASGLRNREIGDRLGLTEGSVKWYMQRIYDKVGTRRRSVAVERARQFGFLE